MTEKQKTISKSTLFLIIFFITTVLMDIFQGSDIYSTTNYINTVSAVAGTSIIFFLIIYGLIKLFFRRPTNNKRPNQR